MKKLLTAVLIAVSINMSAWGCHTPEQSAKLQKQYPDWDFVGMMHKAHSQPYQGYKYNGPQACINGRADIFECNNVDLLGHLDLSQIGGGQGSDSWGWKHEASGRYFALVGRSNGTSFVEITDPTNPIYIGNLPSTNGFSSAWRDIKTYQEHAFIVADGINHGMQVFNLTRLLNVPKIPMEFEPDKLFTTGNLQNAHNIVINEATGFAYTVGGNLCGGGLNFINIQNPTNPTREGCFFEDGYTHDAQCLIYTGPDADYRGREICFASNEDTVTVVDVTNKSNPVMISRTGYTGQQYTHQGWLTEDQKYFIIDDELDELDRGNGQPDFTRTYVMDMSDLDAPTITGFHNAEGAAIDHNQYIVDGRTYQANYVRGLRILELGDLDQADMTEVAYFDSFPDPDSTSRFGGAWNVYPFFDNGMVLISDINRGVFIVKPQLEPVTQIEQHHSGLWYNADQTGHGLSIDILENNQIVIFWYTYDNDGNQLWLLGAGSYEGGQATLTVTTTKNAFFPPGFVANDVETTDWGTFEISFNGCSEAEFKWFPNEEVDYTAGSMLMTHLAQNAGLACVE
ncbi:MAG: choice-of-anchor B family protein [Marinicella sp.]